MLQAGDFFLFAHKAGKEDIAVSPENVDEIVEQLSHHNYKLPGIKGAEQLIPLYLQFREEGKKNFELTIKYKAKKLMNDGTYNSEFTLENKQSFSIEVLCPFSLECNLLSHNPSHDAIQTMNNINKYTLEVQKKSALDVCISTKSFQDVAIHGISLKLKEDEAS